MMAQKNPTTPESRTTKDDMFRMIRGQLYTNSNSVKAFSDEFLNCRVTDNRILYFEPTVFHAEIITGFARYFLDLNYGVDVLLCKENLDMKVFHGFATDRVRFFEHQFQSVESLLKLNKTKEYKFVFIGTEFNFGSLDYLPRNTFFIMHDLRSKEAFATKEIIPHDQVIVLGNFPNNTMVAPMYYKDNVKHLDKNDFVKFISVGCTDKNRRNYRSLTKAIGKIKQSDLNFRVTLVGKIEAAFPKDLQSHVELSGFIDFEQMYNKMEESDFFLTLLDPSNEKHLRYITTGITGAVMLIYGFLKPPLIQRKFADFYGFNDGNSIIYDDDLEVAMIRAMNMSKSEYENMRSNLNILSKDIYNKSFNNLRKLLNV